ncbi:glycoside hydrolase family 32 protein [Paenibacillus caui]|uniref:glycoside hydrolase family 32 protein n=1 Tax=Paenibacillus caui TaxID=2873927 RepID=UPI001CA91B09|nr:glycoside hydrolase family 32 protein [Paenibacillus caui]
MTITSAFKKNLWISLCAILITVAGCSGGNKGAAPDISAPADSAGAASSGTDSGPAGGSQSTTGSAAPSTNPATALQASEQPFVRVPDRIFWKPPEGWVGDVMPFNNGKQIELYYLQDWRNDAPGFHPIFQVTTSNLIDYTYKAEAIPFSEAGKQDLAIGTGSVIKAGDTYHFYYTGHNWMFPDENKPKEAVMHAVSKDLKNWKKVPEDTFYAPEGYERDDFRDPFVIWNEEKQEYWMLVSARQKGVSGGVLALFTSKDMSHWKYREPLKIEDTDNYFMLECADLFKIGDTWYMVFSEFSDKGATHYRMSKSLNGPWKKPAQDLFDGKGFYAAKTGALGNRTFLFGWVPTRQNEKDYMKWDWAGNMASHELIQNPDKTLAVKVPDEVGKLFSLEAPLKEVKTLGEASGSEGSIQLQGKNGLAGLVFEQLPATAKITGTVTFDADVKHTGIVFGAGDQPEKAYGIRLEPGENRVRYDAAPGDALGSLNPDIQVPIELTANTPYSFTLIVENDVCTFYIQDSVALTTRIYKMPGKSWGWYSGGGLTTVKDLKMLLPSS